MNVTTKKCVEKSCGKMFQLSPDQVNFFITKKLDLPRRCKECRDRRKAQKEKEKVQENSPFFKAKKTLEEGIESL